MSGIAQVSGRRKTQILSAAAPESQQNQRSAKRKIATDGIEEKDENGACGTPAKG
jgi:hypothetical protein